MTERKCQAIEEQLAELRGRIARLERPAHAERELWLFDLRHASQTLARAARDERFAASLKRTGVHTLNSAAQLCEGMRYAVEMEWPATGDPEKK